MKRKSSFRSNAQRSWFSATTTVPPCAPHPALIRIRQPFAPSTRPIEVSATPSLSRSPRAPAISMTVVQPRSPKKAAPFPKRYPSKYHPYSRAHALVPNHFSEGRSVGSSVSFGSRPSAMKSMPSRATVENTTSHPVTWVAALEFAVPSASRAVIVESMSQSASKVATIEPVSGGATDDYTLRLPSGVIPVNSMSFPADRVTSLGSTTSSGSRVTSFNSTSSFGSRTSSISSLESSFPVSPALQPQVDDIFLGHQDLQFLGEMSDFDQLMTGNTQMPFSDDLFSPKPDGVFGYALPYLQNALASLPMNFVQTLS